MDKLEPILTGILACNSDDDKRWFANLRKQLIEKHKSE